MTNSSVQIVVTECGPAVENAVVQEGAIGVTLLREPMTRADWTTHDYNVHFCVALLNNGSGAEEVSLSVDGGTWDELPDRVPILYTAGDEEGPWLRANFAARTDLKKKYAIKVPIAPGERILIANTVPRCLDSLQRRYDDLAARGGARRVVYGRSLENRELVGYAYGQTDSRATVLITSGFHPPEPDTLATEAIMDWLAGADAGPVVNSLAFMIVPIANPDGYARQTQGSNAAGVNLFWDFRVEDPDRCPEATALWHLAEGLVPRAYIDFHAYTFQLDKAAGPYCKPQWFYRNARARRAVQSIYARLLAVPNTAPVTGFPSYAPATLGQRLTQAFDTISIAKYHLHLKESVDACRTRGRIVAQSVAEELIAHGLVERSRASENSYNLAQRAQILWAGFLRPTLGLLRRGRFAEVDLRRFALVLPIKR